MSPSIQLPSNFTQFNLFGRNFTCSLSVHLFISFSARFQAMLFSHFQEKKLKRKYIMLFMTILSLEFSPEIEH